VTRSLFYYSEDGGNLFPCKFGTYPQEYVKTHSRPQLSSKITTGSCKKPI